MKPHPPILILMVILLASAACTGRPPVQEIVVRDGQDAMTSELREIGSGARIYVVLADGSALEGEWARVGPDSLFLRSEPLPYREYAVPIDSILRVEVRSPGGQMPDVPFSWKWFLLAIPVIALEILG